MSIAINVAPWVDMAATMKTKQSDKNTVSMYRGLKAGIIIKPEHTKRMNA
jgi:hypothetical protein